MGDVDKEEIDLDDDDDNEHNEKDIARFVPLHRDLRLTIIRRSTVQRARRDDVEPADDNELDDDDTSDRPFTLNEGDELSDDEQLDDTEHESAGNAQIRDNFKVDNDRGANTDRV